MTIRKLQPKRATPEATRHKVLNNAHFNINQFPILNEIDPDSFKAITKNFTARGSNKPIATVVWYLTLIKMRRQFNSKSIDFPVVFDSPNNVETDDLKTHDLLQYILDENKDGGQLVLSSLGFNADKFSTVKPINIINLENDKYHLLDELSYKKYFQLLSELCDAE